MAKYFIIENGKQAGPFNLYELKDRNVMTDTPVWTEGMSDWVPAYAVDEVSRFLFPGKTPPPVSESGCSEYKPVGKSKMPCKRRMMFLLIPLLLVLMILAFTCPGKKAHKAVLKKELSVAFSSANSFLGKDALMVTELLEMPTVDEMLDNVLVYHNYLLWSTTEVQIGGRSHTISYGMLTKVFALNLDNLFGWMSTVELPTARDREEPHDDFVESTDSEMENKTDSADFSTVGKLFWKMVRDKAVEKLQKEVRKHVEEHADSTTVESTEKILDELLKLIEK